MTEPDNNRGARLTLCTPTHLTQKGGVIEISRNAIEEFKRLYHQELGLVIDDSAARHEAERLLSLAKVLIEPIDSDRDTAFLEELRWSTRKKGSKI